MQGTPEPVSPPVPGPIGTAAGAPPSAAPPKPVSLGTATAPPRRTPWIPIAAVVVVAVAIVAVLAVSGVFSSGSGVGSDAATSYLGAVGPAMKAANGTAAGPWVLTAALGLGTSGPLTESNAGGIVGSGCSFTPSAGAPTSVMLPATASGATPGAVAAWAFLASNGVANTSLLILVVGGVGTAMGVAVGSCATTFNSLGAIGTTEVNSTAIAASFDAAGGSGFLANNTVATKLFVLLGPSSDTGGRPVWEVSYTTCVFATTEGQGSEYSAYYYADTGALLGGPYSATESCDSL